MTTKKKTSAQIAAEKRRADLKKQVLKALTKKPISMRDLAAKLGKASADNTVKASVATNIRAALAELIEDGKAQRTGGPTRLTTYCKI